MMKYLSLGLLLVAGMQNSLGQSTAFTYQGRLSDGAGVANGVYDFEFAVFSAGSGGASLAGPTTTSGIAVSNGFFVVTLDFGAGVFTGAERWLELGVRTNGGTSFTSLSPRTEVTPTPYALHARNVASGGVVGTHSEGVTFDNPANVLVGTFGGDGAGVTNVNAATLGGLSAAALWQLGGNAGTIAGPNYLGTADDQPLELKVNGVRAMRLEPAPETPNVVGGVAANSVTPGVRGATIAGGGLPAFPNEVSADFGAVGGGTFNVASGPWATIAGGRDNRARSESTTVAGGFRNTIQTNSLYGTIGGGVVNLIQSNSASATIAGGSQNVVETNSSFAAIGGGAGNTNQFHSPYGTIPGGFRNQVGPGSTAATVGGGQNNRASANHATVSGGLNNTNTGPGATIGGGNGNVTFANDTVIGGGIFNTINSDSFAGVVGGGRLNRIGPGSAHATIGGGGYNEVGNSFAVVSGGFYNTNAGLGATISGGTNNTITDFGLHAAIGGGRGNRAANVETTIGGGLYNVADGYISTIGGGQFNQSPGQSSTIGGGAVNRTDGGWATVPGGANNSAAGDFSFAAGRQAKANHAGTFVWSDPTGTEFTSTATNQFLVRASGGVGINTNSPTAALHVGGSPGVDGIRFPDGTLQTTAATAPTIPQVLFASGLGSSPATTNAFLAAPVTVTITGAGQRVLVTSHKAFGSTATGGATSLDLYIGFRLSSSLASPITVGGGILGNRVAINTRITMGLSAVITGLAPGNYQVGLAGSSANAVNWNSNEYSYTTAVVY
jgi:hypothetical protein